LLVVAVELDIHQVLVEQEEQVVVEQLIQVEQV
jgi:hypothetical protein